MLKNNIADIEQLSCHFYLCFLLKLQAVKVINRSSTTDCLISLQMLTNAALPPRSVIQRPIVRMRKAHFIVSVLVDSLVMGNLASVRLFFKAVLVVAWYTQMFGP